MHAVELNHMQLRKSFSPTTTIIVYIPPSRLNPSCSILSTIITGPLTLLIF
jgi:hypothetical protein